MDLKHFLNSGVFRPYGQISVYSPLMAQSAFLRFQAIFGQSPCSGTEGNETWKENQSRER